MRDVFGSYHSRRRTVFRYVANPAFCQPRPYLGGAHHSLRNTFEPAVSHFTQELPSGFTHTANVRLHYTSALQFALFIMLITDRRMDQPCTLSLEDEEPIIEHRVGLTMATMLNIKELKLPSTFEETRLSAARFAEEIRRLEEQRLQQHTWGLLHVLSTKRAAYEILCWRMFPINNLPVEVLEHIFAACLASLSAADVYRCRKTLMAVCSHWLKVVINTPLMYVDLLRFARSDVNSK